MTGNMVDNVDSLVVVMSQFACCVDEVRCVPARKRDAGTRLAGTVDTRANRRNVQLLALSPIPVKLFCRLLC